MGVELIYLAGISLITALMWVPYVTNMIMVRGVVDAVGYPDSPPPLTPWAQRMKAAHANAIENLPVFAALVLTANALDISNDTTVLASMLFFWARIAHFVVYAVRIPLARTLAFVAGVVAQVMIALQILA